MDDVIIHCAFEQCLFPSVNNIPKIASLFTGYYPLFVTESYSANVDDRFDDNTTYDLRRDQLASGLVLAVASLANSRRVMAILRVLPGRGVTTSALDGRSPGFPEAVLPAPRLQLLRPTTGIRRCLLGR